jgi:hypothetical protein
MDELIIVVTPDGAQLRLNGESQPKVIAEAYLEMLGMTVGYAKELRIWKAIAILGPILAAGLIWLIAV